MDWKGTWFGVGGCVGGALMVVLCPFTGNFVLQQVGSPETADLRCS